jgi:hypothetical protein
MLATGVLLLIRIQHLNSFVSFSVDVFDKFRQLSKGVKMDDKKVM